MTPTNKLADALGCFWNAALGATHTYNDATANAVMSGMVQGVAAVAERLRELDDAAPQPAPAPVQVDGVTECDGCGATGFVGEMLDCPDCAGTGFLDAVGNPADPPEQPPAPGEAELPLGTDPVAWTFQHEDTGRMTTLENDGINNPENFVANNPRFVLCEPLYSAKQVREAVRAAIAALAQGRVPDAVRAALAELERATRKFPTWPTDPLHAVAVLGEEAGELTKAVLQAVYEPHKSTPEDVATEAIQTAAMALRFIESLSRYEYARGEQHSQDLGINPP